MTYSAIIIDDEPKGRISLKQKLADYCPGIIVIAEAEDGFEGITLIHRHQPDIVFLDIEMPRMTGFEMLKLIPEKNFQVIFTTAYDQYAIKAIKFSAFDYLLKPVDIEELIAAVKNLDTTRSSQTKIQSAILQENIEHPNRQLNKLAIPTVDGLLFFDINTIIHLQANSNYTIIHFSDKPKITASKTLKEFEELLPKDIFFRPHNSHIINLNYIAKYTKGDGGEIKMQNGDVIDVARRKKEEFLKIIKY